MAGGSGNVEQNNQASSVSLFFCGGFFFFLLFLPSAKHQALLKCGNVGAHRSEKFRINFGASLNILLSDHRCVLLFFLWDVTSSTGGKHTHAVVVF